MASVTRSGTVDSVAHTKTAGVHVYSATVTYTWTEPNPNPPPAEFEESVTEIHSGLDESFYRDFQARIGSTVTTSYDDSDASRTVSGVKAP